MGARPPLFPRRARTGSSQRRRLPERPALPFRRTSRRTILLIRSIDLDRYVVAETIELRQKNLALVESLHSGGADSEVDVAEAETELASAQADYVGLDLTRAQLENALAVLCGQIASGFSLAETTNIYKAPAIPVGLPADLLERRPDVAEAERDMAAASEGIGVAKAAYFPSIQLTGAAGTESVDLQGYFQLGKPHLEHRPQHQHSFV